jgi:hypothetical protein
MKPFLWRNVVPQATAAKDVLSDEGDEGCMLCIVIERVAEADTLEDEPSGLTDHLAEARLTPAIGLIIKTSHVLPECVGEYRGRSEHETPLPFWRSRS